jgi:hypothetical protein
MGIIALSALVMAGTGFYLFTRSLVNFRPNHKKILEDLKQIREEVLNSSQDLAPLRMEDLEVLSTRQVDRTVKKKITNNVRGTFVTIFEEPAVVYHYRKYLSNNRDSLLFAKTYHHEYYFWVKGKDANLVIDEQAVGVYQYESGILIGSRSQKMMAKLDKNNPDKMPLSIQGKAVGNILRPQTNVKDVLSQRCFDFVRNDLTKEEEALLLAIAVFEMVNRTVDSL